MALKLASICRCQNDTVVTVKSEKNNILKSEPGREISHFRTNMLSEGKVSAECESIYNRI